MDTIDTWHIETLYEQEPNCQVVELCVAEELQRVLNHIREERNAALDKITQLEKVPYTKTREEFMLSWGVAGMSADKQRLANAAWDRAEWFFNQKTKELQKNAERYQWILNNCLSVTDIGANVIPAYDDTIDAQMSK